MLTALISLCLLPGGARAETDNPAGYRLSEAVVHGNLAIYFVHGASRAGPVPLTLQEAMAKRVITVRETGRVNELEVENTGDEDVFIQSGDIVKGGQQDRVLGVSLVLPPHSGATPIASFCVESGRWSARGGEDARNFSSANAALPSRQAKLALAGAAAPRPAGAPSPLPSRQQQIWQSVAEIQHKLSSNLGAPVASARSRTSLQLALENDRLTGEQAEYVAALEPRGKDGHDIIGFAFAVNGKLNGADIYPSNGLFRKMWPKLLRASVTEAIGERDGASDRPPPPAEVSGFIDAANGGAAVAASGGEQTNIRVRDSAGAMVLEARPAAAPATEWVHRSYLAK
jgi:hypothetical protein